MKKKINNKISAKWLADIYKTDHWRYTDEDLKDKSRFSILHFIKRWYKDELVSIEDVAAKLCWEKHPGWATTLLAFFSKKNRGYFTKSDVLKFESKIIKKKKRFYELRMYGWCRLSDPMWTKEVHVYQKCNKSVMNPLGWFETRAEGSFGWDVEILQRMSNEED